MYRVRHGLQIRAIGFANPRHPGIADGKTFADYDNNSLSNVVIYDQAFSSYRNVAHTILHEFGHVNSIMKGYLFNNIAKYTHNIGVAIDEIYAYKFGMHHGGTPYNTAYNVNAAFLKNTMWKIDANKLSLPSFD